MFLGGLQKLTLLDYPGCVACTVFTAGCNLRCPFCQNAPLVTELPAEPALSTAALLDFLARRRGLLDGVCLTGGEPLAQPDLPELIARIRELGFRVKLDTNGAFPEKLARLMQAGQLDYVAMDVKNCPARYAETCGIPGLDLAPFRESVQLLLAGGVDYEFRTTVVRELHTRADIAALGAWIAGAKRYFLQAFRDSGALIQPGLTGCSEPEMRGLLAAAREFVPAAELRGL